MPTRSGLNFQQPQPAGFAVALPAFNVPLNPPAPLTNQWLINQAQILQGLPQLVRDLILSYVFSEPLGPGMALTVRVKDREFGGGPQRQRGFLKYRTLLRWGHASYYPFRFHRKRAIQGLANKIKLVNICGLLHADNNMYWECLAHLIQRNEWTCDSNKSMFFFLKHASRSTPYGPNFPQLANPGPGYAENFWLRKFRHIAIQGIHTPHTSALFNMLAHCTRLEYLEMQYCQRCRWIGFGRTALKRKIRNTGERVNRHYGQRIPSAAYADCNIGVVTTRKPNASNPAAPGLVPPRVAFTAGPHPMPNPTAWVHELHLRRLKHDPNCGCEFTAKGKTRTQPNLNARNTQGVRNLLDFPNSFALHRTWV